MRKIGAWALSVLMVAAVAGALGRAPATAQESLLPPTIIAFTVSPDTLALPAVEAGETQITLEWQTVGVAETDRIALEALVLNDWAPVVPPETVLPPNGLVEFPVQSPLSFGPPTYRLTILDAQGALLDQRITLIRYEIDPDALPIIESVVAPVESVNLADLASGTARVPVVWAVLNRQPGTNLQFDQLLDGQRVVPVELPRDNLWIPSSGEGVLAPVAIAAGEPVQLRLRVVDLRDGAVLAEQLLPPIHVTGGAVAPVAPVVPDVPVPTGVPQVPAASPTPAAEVLSFEAAPETLERGGTVTLSWEVSGATQVTLWRLAPTGQIAEEAPITATVGTWTVTLPDYYVDTASFVLNAIDAAGQMTQAGLTVNIICPYTYFFTPNEPLACPQSPAKTVQAAWQGFENGIMLWRADTSEILVLYDDSGRVERYRDTWQGETVIFPAEPPAGLFQPVRGFGKVWIENPAVREGLGWATTLEQGYTMQYQSTGDYRYARLYMTLPDGSLIYVVENSWATG